jgi:hypothetical protein
MLIGVSFLLSLPEGLHVERIEPQGALLTITVGESSALLLVAHSALKRHRRSTVDIGGPYVMFLVEAVRSSFISLPASSSVVILTALEKSLPSASLPLFSRGPRSPPGSLKRCRPLDLPRAGNWEHDWPTVLGFTPHQRPRFAASWLLLPAQHHWSPAWG